VQKIENETDEDTAFLNRYRGKHEVLSHISDDAYQEVIDGMHDVVTMGTARVAMIPGIDVCAKTGTAQNSRIIDGKKLDLPNNSMFVCFAPKENPKIAIAVAVENAGYGSTWAGPIARILMEKYLNDTIQEKSKADVERISNAKLMPVYLKRLQFIEDSTRAHKWLETYKDSTYLKKFLSVQKERIHKWPVKKDDLPSKELKKEIVAILPDEKQFRNPLVNLYPSEPA
jgi:penicillin-binding protein 2